MFKQLLVLCSIKRLTMYFRDDQEIETLVAQFQSQTLALDAWTHEAHLTVALWHLKNYSLAEATCYLRSGIITYNNAVGTPNNPSRGYHETLTLFWIKIVCHFVTTNSDKNLLTLCNIFLESAYAAREFPLQFYSRDLLFSTEARAFWVEPDQKALVFK